MSVAGWLFDLLGIRAITDAIGSVLPQRQTLRFFGATVVDNIVNGSTDVTVAASAFRWVATAAPAAAAADRVVCVLDTAPVFPLANESAGQFVVTQAFTATYFSFLCGRTALATDTVLCVVRKNGVDTALTFTIPAGTVPGATVTDSAHSVSFARGDKVSIRLRQSGATTQAAWYGLFQIG